MGLYNNNFAFSILLGLVFLFAAAPPSASQLTPAAVAPPPSLSPEEMCNGIFLSYTFQRGLKIPPNDSTDQPYRFESLLMVLNNGREELKEWRVFVGFRHREILVSATNALLVNGTDLPAPVGNGTVFGGYPVSDLKTAIQTAGDLNQFRALVSLVGTQFGVAPPAAPLPGNLTLVNDGWICPMPTLQPSKTEMTTCCTRDPSIKVNDTISDNFLPRQTGDLTIMYDVVRAYDQNYLAQVTIENHSPLGRLDHWQLSFDWKRNEFIQKMQGAYPTVVDATGCIYGTQAQVYTNLDFADVISCERRPVIVDLPPTKADDPTYGKIPSCCRNGTILPRVMDPSKSASVFLMQVFKMPPDFNSSALFPPQNWQINGMLNPDYQCGLPIRVSPSLYPDPSGIETNKTAFASWQVVCNITHPKNAIPKCCVSFSAFYNDSIVPCKTCACGCGSETQTTRTCSATSPALLIPPDALLVPFENRTALTVAWAALKHYPVPNPMPCGDNCGVSINWHLASDYRGGWTTRVTIFNWEEINFPDWFVAVQMDKLAVPGYEKTYSFNASVMSVNGGVNNTIFMQGLPGMNYLVAETDGLDPDKNPRVPGKQQSVIQFSKKHTPGVRVPERDGFPAKVIFNGEECLLPDVFPTAGGNRIKRFMVLPFLAVVLTTILMLTQR
ncbi:PREDICTED: COBRA-like protein 9 [Tarenaya hassleriana]|uniref:COBRA-like protein 9 n=1 Tax=Tarenaya hassleriana TaxID=28532 RepID=UPI00053CA3B4|nr:PREDICTED: COBRA-like protein 9 [Tarenaya hassleriana]